METDCLTRQFFGSSCKCMTLKSASHSQTSLNMTGLQELVICLLNTMCISDQQNKRKITLFLLNTTLMICSAMDATVKFPVLVNSKVSR